MSNLTIIQPQLTETKFLTNLEVFNTYTSKMTTIPYGNVKMEKNKYYLQMMIPGQSEILSLPLSFGQTMFTEEQARTLLLGKSIKAQVKTGVCDIYFDLTKRYDVSSKEYIGVLDFGRVD